MLLHDEIAILAEALTLSPRWLSGGFEPSHDGLRGRMPALLHLGVDTDRLRHQYAHAGAIENRCHRQGGDRLRRRALCHPECLISGRHGENLRS